MAIKKINNIFILGLGAIGATYAAKLYDMDPGIVKIIASPERIASLQKAGCTVNGKSYSFDFITPDEERPPADLIIIAVKSLHLQKAIQDIKGFVGKDTVVISLLNGISSEELIGQEIGMNHLLFAYGVGMDAVREGTAIKYANIGKVVFGEKNNETYSERVLALKTLFEQAAIPFVIPPDMERALWAKFMMNVGINQVSAVLKAPYGTFQQNKHALELVLMAAEEVLTLSKAHGVPLHHNDINDFVKIINGLNPHGKTSMLQDVEVGRETEVDIFAGTVIELGKKYGIPTPVNDTLYRIIKVAGQTQ
ncbi:MAG: 2-dehydropantoate 2-reductase [Mucilaginibacter sp.]|nr:2-dehydropantoate 2-reductase [Mucilaginibacter sp.]